MRALGIWAALCLSTTAALAQPAEELRETAAALEARADALEAMAQALRDDAAALRAHAEALEQPSTPAPTPPPVAPPEPVDPPVRPPADPPVAPEPPVLAWGVVEGEVWSALLRDERAEAVEALSAWLEANPDHAPGYALRAYARLERSVTGALRSDPATREAALVDAERALELDPDRPLAALVEGEVWAQAEPARALQWVAQALARDESLVWGWILRGRLLEQVGDVEGAMDSAAQVLELAPEHPAGWLLTARLKFARRNFTGALEAAERVTQLAPSLTEGHTLRGRCLVYLRRQPDALEALSHALTIDPRDADALFYRAAAHHDLGQYEEALRDLTWLEEAPGEIPEAHRRLVRGHSEFELELWEEAAESYARYLEVGSPSSRVQTKVQERLEICRAQQEEALRRQAGVAVFHGPPVDVEVERDGELVVVRWSPNPSNAYVLTTYEVHRRVQGETDWERVGALDGREFVDTEIGSRGAAYMVVSVAAPDAENPSVQELLRQGVPLSIDAIRQASTPVEVSAP